MRAAELLPSVQCAQIRKQLPNCHIGPIATQTTFAFCLYVWLAGGGGGGGGGLSNIC